MMADFYFIKKQRVIANPVKTWKKFTPGIFDLSFTYYYSNIVFLIIDQYFEHQ